ncbi:hypothetical protein ACO0LC_28545 [Undibacterium sp. JH2W]|uniref:hypothetical protein n=1 Tax=Undibacterium sp. JH2W TaxID=3413037 RepID=UPI003BF226CF
MNPYYKIQFFHQGTDYDALVKYTGFAFEGNARDGMVVSGAFDPKNTKAPGYIEFISLDTNGEILSRVHFEITKMEAPDVGGALLMHCISTGEDGIVGKISHVSSQ